MLDRNPRNQNNKRLSRLERPLSHQAKQSLLDECFRQPDNTRDLNGDYEPDVESPFGVE